MKKTPQFLEYFLQDCLNWDPQFTKKSMFWWYWIYKNKKIFALYVYDEIYFKVWENNIDNYKKYWSSVFEYNKSGKKMILSYYTIPEEILENREQLNIWIERSLDVESKTKNSKKTKKYLELNQRILEELLKIPKGKVTTYKNLADKFWVHSRRIASVMKTNKNPDIFPCYKVISHSWKLSWYSWPDWTNSKISMLEVDWIKIIDWKIGKEFIV